jgi:L-asparaginase/Glu-tRNA(Gln) amidotransferase subunit D
MADMSGPTARLGLVLTGGTIGSNEVEGMLVVDLTQASSEREAQLVRRSWTGPQKLNVLVRTPLRKFSEDMTPADWVTMAKCIRELVEVDNVHNVLVLHGTDTMGFTSAALSFLLADLDVTVVLTGSNLPLDDSSSDGPTNIRDALLASHAMPRGVYLSFAGTLGASSEVHIGTTVRKVRSQGRAYDSPNHGPIAHVAMGAVKMLKPWSPTAGLRADEVIEGKVHAFTLFPGIDLEMVADGLISRKKRGVVVRLYPGVTGPELAAPDSLPHFIRRCVSNDIAVVTCVERFVDAAVEYPSGNAMRRSGAIFARDMIYETAYVKLCWAIAHASSREEVEELFTTPIAGELMMTPAAYPTA